MPSLKSRSKCPPNGFQFTQAQTGWTQQWWDFEQAVKDIYNHRVANPRFNLSTNLEDIRVELDQTNALRCLSINGGNIYVNAGLDPPKFQAHHVPVPAVVGVVKSGLATVGAWLGKGGVPVSQDLSNSRAIICARCPKNGAGDWTTYFTEPAAKQIKKWVEYKNQMKLSTTNDEKLGTCMACSCPLTLKVHTPLVDIVEHMSAEVKQDLDPSCWILSETNEKYAFGNSFD